MKWRKQIHQSGLSMINRCAMQFYFAYIEHRRRPTASFLIAGKAVDTAVGYDLNTKIVSGVLAPRDEVLDAARDAVVNNPQAQEVEPVDDDEKGQSREQILAKTTDKAVRLVDSHHKLVAPTIQPYRVARKFSVTLDKFLHARATTLHEEKEHGETRWERRMLLRQAEALNAAARDGWDFVGEQDIVQGIMLADKLLDLSQPFSIRDTKTARASKNQSMIDSDDQLTGYAMASMVIDGRLPDDVRLDVLVDLKRGVKPQLLKSVRTKADVDVFLNRLANAISAIQQGVFVPTNQANWWCSTKFCSFSSHCPYFKQPKSIPVSLPMEGKADDRMPKVEKPKATLIQIDTRKPPKEKR